MFRQLRPLVLLALVASGVAPRVATAQVRNTCQLGSPAGTVQHVIYLQFDNVHLARDNPNVPSDLEQMPHLLNFLTANGTVLTQQHTPLIAHTGGDIVSVQTGLYPDRQGLAVSNSYRYFTPDGPSRTGVAFTYWTSPVFDPGAANPADTSFNMLGPDGRNTPAPWVPFTRAGCNVGTAGIANAEIENTAIDVSTVFGAGSAQAQEVASSPDQAFADFVGNRQYITSGNLAENDRAFLFLMNYAERERIKIWGRARLVTDDAALFDELAQPDYKAEIEQAIVLHVTAWDANCHQHIPRLVHAEGVEASFAALRQRIKYLEMTLGEAGVAFAPADASM